MAVAGLANNGYNVPNTRVECVLKNTHLPVWFWRAPGANQNVFAIESFLDEIAAAGGQDPYQLRRKLLEGKPDWLKVLDTAAEKGDWGKPLPKGSGRGIAICEDTDSLCAQVAEVTVRPKGEVKVDRVTVALDTRYMVNPLTIAEQVEGAVIFGLTAALYGKITIKNGVPVQGNFDTYRMVRLAEAPKIDVHLVPSGGKKWGGAGEPATPPIARRGRQCDLRRDRQAHPQPADHGPRPVRSRHSRRDLAQDRRAMWRQRRWLARSSNHIKALNGRRPAQAEAKGT